MRRGPPKGSKYCDFLETLRFLRMFRRKPRNPYQLYRGRPRFDIKKTYRYLRYCVEVNLIEIDHIERGGRFPSKYYRLTNKGRALVELFGGLGKNISTVKP